MRKKITKPNYAFIDSQNLNLGIKSMGWQLDFKEFRKYLQNKYNIKEAFLFIGHVSGNELLYSRLQRFGYVVIFKPTLEYRKNNKKIIKGNVDAELVLHAMIEYQNYDKAVIISGDGDFHCLIEHLSLKRKLLKILTPNKKYSSLLKKFAEYIFPLHLLKKKLAMR